MANMNLQELNDRLNTAKLIKDLWLELYLEVFRFVTPDRDDRNIRDAAIRDTKRRSELIYDSTALLAADQRSNELQGLILPESRPWGKFEIDNNRTNTIAISDIDLNILNTKINSFINNSDLQVAAGGAFLDLTIGMGALWIRSSDEIPLSFKAISSLSLYPEFTTENVIDTAWTKHAFTGKQILDEYPNYKGSQRTALDSHQSDVHFLWIGEIRDNDKYFTYGVLDNDRFTFLFKETKPYKRLIIFRDKVRPGEVQGRGIAMDLIPTIRDLNTLVKDFLKVMDYKANPPIFFDPASKFNPYALKNIGGVYIPKVGDRLPLEAMNMPNAPEVFEMIQDMRNTIREGFKIDELGEIGTPIMSATEVSIRENKAQRTSATNIARLIMELPKQLYISCAQILNERQLLGNNIDINDKRLRFNYTSPLLDIQKQNNLISLERVTQYIQQNFGEGATLAAFNLSTLIPFLYDNFNLKPELFNNGGEVQKAVTQVAQGAQQQAPQATTTAVQPPQIAQPQTLI